MAIRGFRTTLTLNKAKMKQTGDRDNNKKFFAAVNISPTFPPNSLALTKLLIETTQDFHRVNNSFLIFWISGIDSATLCQTNVIKCEESHLVNIYDQTLTHHSNHLQTLRLPWSGNPSQYIHASVALVQPMNKRHCALSHQHLILTKL